MWVIFWKAKNIGWAYMVVDGLSILPSYGENIFILLLYFINYH